MFDLREMFKDDDKITVVEITRPLPGTEGLIVAGMFSGNYRQFAYSDRGNNTKQYAFCTLAEYEIRGDRLMASCRNSMGGPVDLVKPAQ